MFKVRHAHYDLEDLTTTVIRPYRDLHDRTTIIKICIFLQIVVRSWPSELRYKIVLIEDEFLKSYYFILITYVCSYKLNKNLSIK